jgi:hypothetical protein
MQEKKRHHHPIYHDSCSCSLRGRPGNTKKNALCAGEVMRKETKKETSRRSNLSERFIGILANILHGKAVAVVVGRGMAGTAHVRALDSFVCVGCLFGHEATATPTVAVERRSTGAAAGAEQPEQSARQRKEDGKVRRHVDIPAHAPADSVLLQGGIEGAGQDGEQDGRRHRGGDGKQGRNLEGAALVKIRATQDWEDVPRRPSS